MDNEKAIRAAKLTLGGILEKRRAKTAVERAQGQIAPSKYLPGVPRQVHAEGGPAGMGDNGGPPLSEPPVDLGQAREQKQMQTYHTGMMDDIHQRMNNAMDAHEKAVGQGVFDGYEVGDTLQGSAHPMRITGRYMQKWKPTSMALRSFDRMGTKPTIIEHEGEQYIPMLRYETGKEGVDGFQQGSAYLDGVKAAGYQKMGGLRAVKARGGAVEFMRDNHPLVPDELYHGNAPKVATKGWTSEIDHDQTAKNIEAQDFREFRPSEHGNYGPGIYLSDSPKVASDFAQGIRADQTETKPHGQVMKLHVSMKQPFHDDVLRHPAWKDYIKGALTRYSIPHGEDRDARDAILKALDNGTATVRDLFLRDTPRGTLVNQHGQHDIHDVIRNSGFDGIIAHGPDGSKEYVAFKPEQVKSALSARKFDPTSPDMTYADGGAAMFEGMHEDLQNEDGTPMDLWHGTPSEGFSEFKDEKLGSTRDHGFYGRGHYLTPDQEGASEYAGESAEEGTLMGPLHAALKNPYVWDASDKGAHSTLRDLQSMGIMKDKDKLEPWDNLQRHHIDPFMREMQKRGHDGVIVRTNDYTGEKPHRVSEVVVFKPTAIKHKDAERFDPNDPNIYRAAGGEVDGDKPIDLASARAARNPAPTPIPEPEPELVPGNSPPPPEVSGMFDRLAEKRQKSQVAFEAADADGIFDKFPMGDVYRYKHKLLPNYPTMKVVGHRMLHVDRWGDPKPPKYVYHDHFPVLDMDAGNGEINPYPVELLENKDRYDWVSGKPRAVKAGGGSVGGMMMRMRRAGINTRDDFWNRWRDYMRAKAGPDTRLSMTLSPDSHFKRIDAMLGSHRQTADEKGLSQVLKNYGPPSEQGHMAARFPREILQGAGIEPTAENAHAVYEALPDDESGRLGFSNGGLADDNESGVSNNLNGGSHVEANTSAATVGAAPRTQAGEFQVGRGARGGSGLLQASDEAPLEGLPREVSIPMTGQVITAGPDLRVRKVARDYMASTGMRYNPPTKYAKVDPSRSKRISDAYEKMKDDASDPLTKASYDAMIKETMAQYHAAKAAGFKAEFWNPETDEDPYHASPRLATEDIRNNHHMWVYPTDAGYGSDGPITEEQIRKNPMLRPSGETWNGVPVTVNDIFRAVHDYFGHAKEGVGFRGNGEENAWRSHAAMFSPLARLAMTAETRGQNSWLNYGPFGDKNRKARTEDSTFAPQKIGVLPHWVHHEGAEDFILPEDVAEMQRVRLKHSRDMSRAMALTRPFTKKG